MKRAIASTALGLLTACSNQQLYQAIQENRQQECRRTSPSPVAYEECMQAYRQSYTDYERERQALLKDSGNAAPASDTTP